MTTSWAAAAPARTGGSREADRPRRRSRVTYPGPVSTRPSSLSSSLRQLGPVKVVGLVTIVVVTVVLVWAVLDVRSLLAQAPAAQVAAGPDASAGARGSTTERQVAVTVTFSGTGPFNATVVDASKRERTFRSGGEDVKVTRVYEGAGPYVLASVQTTGNATVRCRVAVDGRQTSSTEQSGLYAQTVCAG